MSAPGGCLLQGVSTPGRGVCSGVSAHGGGGYASGGSAAGGFLLWRVYLIGGDAGIPTHPPPLWAEFLTHAWENITLPQTSFADGKNAHKEK